MEKRLILAFALTIIVFIVFQQFQPKKPDQAVNQQAAKQVQVQDQSAQKSPQSNPAEQAIQPTNVSPEDTSATAQKLTVKGDLYQADIDNRGAVLTGWALNQYKSNQSRIFEMVAPNQGGESRIFPTALLFDDQKLTTQANNEFYQITINGQPYDGKELVPPVTAVFKLKRGGLAVEKRFTFEKENYIVDLSTAAQLDGKPIGGKLFLGQDIGPELEHISSSTKLGVAYYSGGKVHRESPPKDEKEIKKIEGDVRWVGLEMQYFTMIAIPSTPLSSFDIQKLPVQAMGWDGKPVDRDLVKVTAPVNGSSQYQFFIGPKKQSNLNAVHSGDITGVINYGMFSFLVHPLLAALRWIYKYVSNYGYAIIILTFLLSLLLFPLRLKQMLSMKKMQSVQPKVKAIQDKYRKYKKTDPKRAEMNQEIMALYKEHNVNPLGGCLTLLPQLPLLFAFYALLGYSIELRQAPFIWWIHDLSIKDPFYVLPIVMGITSFISQKMTPMTAGTDPAQAKVMMLMPAIFTIMFINLSSGLNLYFLCSNIFQIGFQKIAERWLGGRSSEAKSKS
ncbi:MAG TPA: membrane protein insertase YidC [Acidobacteriota bacterium]|nr:membrane protein insertase YidC [Acidobacteriota bacterium]